MALITTTCNVSSPDPYNLCTGSEISFRRGLLIAQCLVTSSGDITKQVNTASPAAKMLRAPFTSAFAVYPHAWHTDLLCDRRFSSLYGRSTRNAALCTLAEQLVPDLLARAAYTQVGGAFLSAPSSIEWFKPNFAEYCVPAGWAYPLQSLICIFHLNPQWLSLGCASLLFICCREQGNHPLGFNVNFHKVC